MKFKEQFYPVALDNYSRRSNRCEGVVWHHTAGSLESSIRVSMGKTPAKAGYHCIIGPDGKRHCFVDDRFVAYHAGESFWRDKPGANSFTLGVAFTGDTAKRELTAEEIASALEWLETRWERYGWSMSRMTTHRAICRPVGRKADISERAELQLFAEIRRKFVL